MLRFVGALALSLVLAGCSETVDIPTFDDGRTYGQHSEPSASAGAPTFSFTQDAVAPPKSISIPKIGAESTLKHVGLVNGEIDIPPATQPQQAAWWDGSPRPGEVGPAVILGHVDGEVDGRAGQPGVFHKLHTLKQGDVVDIAREDGSTVQFEVYKVERVPKAEFPEERVYGNTDVPELRLITCGGVFDRSVGHYKDNVIAYARQAS